MSIRVITGLALAAILGLSGCKLTTASPEALVAQCQAEVAAPGTYVYEDGQAIPEITAVEDGSEEGAAALNACVRQKAIAAGLLASPVTGRKSVACPDGAATLYGGATYCIGTN